MQYGDFAQVYDPLMADVDYDMWADYICGFIPARSSILECACGTGEISLRLAAKGYKVTATDISEQMLMTANEKQRMKGFANAELRFIRMDMRKLALHRKVDAIVTCCDGVNYLTSGDDVSAFLNCAYSLLKPGGILLFDISSRYKLQNVLGNNCFVENGNDVAYLWKNTYDEKSKLIRMDLSLFIRRGELYERVDETHLQRAHSVREIGSRLERSGFSYEAFSCFTKENVKKDDERIQFVARKI